MKQTKKLKDHREIGRELDLFSFHDVAPGAIFWHPKGWTIYQTLQEFIREKTLSEGYLEISTPIMVKSSLFKQSGHWEHFGADNMFNLAIYEDKEIAARKVPTVKIKVNGKIQEVPEVNYSLKPMNCPETALVYATKTRSYQDLPIKLSDYGILHRRELSGVLGGAFRVRQFVIDDAHLFVRPDQIQEEIHKLLLLAMDVYQSFGFKPKFYLATRPEKAMGDKKTWDRAEKALEKALRDAKVNFDIKPKDGAFYGPKIDIHIRDSQDRDWQLATIQLDFQMPQRMGLNYINKDGKKEIPVMIHRGIFGSFERFIGILIEHYAGAFPVWLSPVQAVIIPIADRHHKYSLKVNRQLKENDIRAEVDDRSFSMQKRIREAELQKIPYMLVVGDKEQKDKRVSVRMRGKKDLGQMSTKRFINKISEEIGKKLLHQRML